MKIFSLPSFAAGLVILAVMAFACAIRANETQEAKIIRLIEELGDEDFETRESASSQLKTIGEPALPALREAASKSDDAEIRLRTRQLVETITALVRAAAAGKAWTRFNGMWRDAAGNHMVFEGDRWTSQAPAFGPVSGTVKLVEVRPNETLADLVTEEGQTKGVIVKAIVHVDGDTLHYCGTYSDIRPTVFRTTDKNVYYALTRVRK